MQCKDIPDGPILRFLNSLNGEWATWFWTEKGQFPPNPEYEFMPENSVQRAMPQGVNDKLRQAKMRQMIRRGVVDGCGCGCRGDYKITDKGRLEIAPPVQQEG